MNKEVRQRFYTITNNKAVFVRNMSWSEAADYESKHGVTLYTKDEADAIIYEAMADYRSEQRDEAAEHREYLNSLED